MITSGEMKEAYNQKYVTGMYLKKRVLPSIKGGAIQIPNSEGLVHLQFRRFAGCPVCSLHLHRMTQEWPQLQAAGIIEVVVFHSSHEELIKYEADLPFHVIADPEKKLYRAFGVEASLYAILNPLAFFPILRSVANSFVNYLKGRLPFPPLQPAGGSLGLPADFLIAPDGKILEFKYGRHADDQWSVADVLQLASKYLAISKGFEINS